jgi:hypothetical protein
MRQALPATSAPSGAPSRLSRWLRLPSRLVKAHQPGQSLLEASFTTGITMMTIFVTLQLSIVIAQQFGAAHGARSTSRWLAVRIDTKDEDVASQARSFATGLPGLSGPGIASVTVVPECPALVGGKCTGRESGQAVTVRVTTSLTSVMFLPTTFGIPPLQFRLPATMPAIAYTVLLE